MMAEASRDIRRALQVADLPANDGQPLWIHLPIARAPLPRRQLGHATYCETLRCEGKQRTATTFHAVINMPGNPDFAWVACADCTGLMTEGAFAG